MTFVVQHLSELWHGLIVTGRISLAAFTLAMLLGVGLALMRVGPIAPLRLLASGYVTAFRNIPLLVLLVLFVFALPEAGLLAPLEPTVITAMGMYAAAFVAETLRSGMQSVKAGEAEAARALGLTGAQTLRFVVLPQTLATVVQPLANILIAVILNSSLAAAVGIVDLTGQTQLLNLRYAEALPTFLAASTVYLVLTLSVGLLAGAAERKTRVAR